MQMFTGWKILMEKKKRRQRSKTRIISPKKDKTAGLSRDEIRSLNKKRIKRKRKIKRIATLSLFSVALAGVCVALVFAIFFKINTIEVHGTRMYSDEQILKESGIDKDDNLFSINENRVNKKVSKSLPYIRSIKVKRRLPDTLVLEVNSSNEIAAIERGSGFVLLDEKGKVLQKNASMLREGVAVVTGVEVKEIVEGEQITLKNESLTENFVLVLNSVKESEINLLTEIQYDKKGNVRFIYDDRIKIELGSTVNLDKKIKRAKATLDKENEINPYSEGVLDLKTEPYVYFRPGKINEPEKKGVNKTTQKVENASEKTTNTTEN